MILDSTTITFFTVPIEEGNSFKVSSAYKMPCSKSYYFQIERLTYNKLLDHIIALCELYRRSKTFIQLISIWIHWKIENYNFFWGVFSFSQAKNVWTNQRTKGQKIIQFGLKSFVTLHQIKNVKYWK